MLLTLVCSHLLGLPFEAALAVGFSLALATHFTLQRFFVWAHNEAFVLPIQHQVGRYLAISLTQYAITATATAVLPRALDAPTDVVYIAAAAILTVANFALFRVHVFHASDGEAS